MALSRAEMEQVLREGGSVLHNNQIITKFEHLPSEAELAKGDPDKEAAAAESLQEQIRQLRDQLASLQASQQPNDKDGHQGQQDDDGMVRQLDALPDDFPFAAELRAGGFFGTEQVRNATDKQLDALPGIDKEAIKQIRAALAG